MNLIDRGQLQNLIKLQKVFPIGKVCSKLHSLAGLKKPAPAMMNIHLEHIRSKY